MRAGLFIVLCLMFSYLGIDWGEKKIGLAIADSETRVAVPFMTVRNDAHLLEVLARIIGERNVRVAVIGIPSHVNRERTVYEGERLGALLAERFGVEIRYENEMFTTKMARAELIREGVRRGLDDLDDRHAARILLEDFLAKRGRL